MHELCPVQTPRPFQKTFRKQESISETTSDANWEATSVEKSGNWGEDVTSDPGLAVHQPASRTNERKDTENMNLPDAVAARAASDTDKKVATIHTASLPPSREAPS